MPKPIHPRRLTTPETDPNRLNFKRVERVEVFALGESDYGEGDRGVTREVRIHTKETVFSLWLFGHEAHEVTPIMVGKEGSTIGPFTRQP